MFLFGFKRSIYNLFVALVLGILASTCYLLSGREKALLQVGHAFSAFAWIFILLFIQYRRKEADRKNKDFLYEEKNHIPHSIHSKHLEAIIEGKSEPKKGEPLRYLLRVLSGCVSVYDRVSLPSGKKATVKNLYFPEERPATFTAYEGEEVVALFSGDPLEVGDRIQRIRKNDVV
ncbi:hypothetical protein [Guggenheimella bovis]